MWFSSSSIGRSEARQSELTLLTDHWKQYCSTRAALALAQTGCRTVQDVAALGRIALGRLQGVGKVTLEELARLADLGGGFADEQLTPQAAIAKALRLSLPENEDAVAAAGDVICALYRSGFVVLGRGEARTT